MLCVAKLVLCCVVRDALEHFVVVKGEESKVGHVTSYEPLRVSGLQALPAGPSAQKRAT